MNLPPIVIAIQNNDPDQIIERLKTSHRDIYECRDYMKQHPEFINRIMDEVPELLEKKFWPYHLNYSLWKSCNRELIEKFNQLVPMGPVIMLQHYLKKDLQFSKYLIQTYNLDPNHNYKFKAYQDGHYFFNPMIEAIVSLDMELIQTLIDFGGHLNVNDDEALYRLSDFHARHKTKKNKSEDMIKHLLKHGLDPTKEYEASTHVHLKYSAVNSAIRHDNLVYFELFNPSIKDIKVYLFEIIYSGANKIFEYITKTTQSVRLDDLTDEHFKIAIESCNKTLVKFFLENNYKPPELNSHVVKKMLNDIFFNQNAYDVMRLLLDHGATFTGELKLSRDNFHYLSDPRPMELLRRYNWVIED